MTTKPQIISQPLTSVICLLSSAERSEVPARRETIIIQFKPNLNIFEDVPSSSMIVTYIPSDTRYVKKTTPIKANLTQFKPNLTQFQKRPKMNITKALTTDYENIRLPSRAKANPIKSNYGVRVT